MKFRNKKALLAALAVVFVQSITSTTFAATSTLSDVPAKHWAYNAVTKLVNDGIIDGYGDGTFRGDRTLTRYEFAIAVSKAIDNYKKADTEDQSEILKLVSEFSDELNNLGVRVSTLEKKASSVKFTGDSRIRYGRNAGLDGTDAPGSDPSHYVQERIRLNITSSLSDKIDFAGRISATNESNKYSGSAGTTKSTTNDLQFDTAKFTFKNAFLGTDVGIGRESLLLTQSGIVSDTAGNVDNVRFNFKNQKLSGFAAFADVAPAYGNNNKNAVDSKNIKIAQLVWKAAKDFQITGGALQSNTDAYAFKQRFIGGSYNLTQDWNVLGDYVKNTAATTQGKGAYAKLSYKGADYKKVGSWGAWVNYEKIGANAVDANLSTLNSFNNTKGVKGIGVGVNYTFAPNAKFTTIVEDLKSFDGNTKFDTFVGSRIELIF